MAFNGRASAYKIKIKSPFSKHMPQIVKMVLLPMAAIFGGGSDTYCLEDVGQRSNGEDIVGDLVLIVESSKT